MEGIKFPANAMLINNALIEIANFEVIPSEELNKKLFYFPEVDSFSLNFQECGIDSLFFLLIIGFPLYIILGHIALLVIYYLLALLNLICCSPRIGKLINYLRKYLFWNGFIRLYMELY